MAGAGCAVCGAVSRPGEAEHPTQGSIYPVHVQGALLAVEKTVSPLECSCLALDPGTLPSTGPCDGKTYQVGLFMLLHHLLHLIRCVSPDLQRGRLPALAQLRPPQLREARLHARHLQDHRGHGGVVRVPGGEGDCAELREVEARRKCVCSVRATPTGGATCRRG